MKYITAAYENRIVINKSEFITHLYPVKSVEEVNEILGAVRKKYYDATHNCYAYILGEKADIQKASDDGEPAKTAGFPMLDVLKKNEVTDVLAVVTRYFGGILLGAGGLVRAYSSSVSEVMKQCEFYVPSLEQNLTLTTSYSGYNTLIKVIPYLHVKDISYTQDVILKASVKEELYGKLCEDLYKYKIENNVTKEDVTSVLIKMN